MLVHNTLRKYMKTNGTYVHKVFGISMSKLLCPKFIRYCPICVVNDQATYGECYWHRIHQASWSPNVPNT